MLLKTMVKTPIWLAIRFSSRNIIENPSEFYLFSVYLRVFSVYLRVTFVAKYPLFLTQSITEAALRTTEDELSKYKYQFLNSQKTP